MGSGFGATQADEVSLRPHGYPKAAHAVDMPWRGRRLPAIGGERARWEFGEVWASSRHHSSLVSESPLLKKILSSFSSSAKSTFTVLRASVILLRHTFSSGSSVPSRVCLWPYC